MWFLDKYFIYILEDFILQKTDLDKDYKSSDVKESDVSSELPLHLNSADEINQNDVKDLPS